MTSDGDRTSDGLPFPNTHSQHVGAGAYSAVQDWNFQARPWIAPPAEYQPRSSTRRGKVNNLRFVHGGEEFTTNEKRLPLEMMGAVATSSVSPTRPCCMRRRDPRWSPPVPLPDCYYSTSESSPSAPVARDLSTQISGATPCHSLMVCYTAFAPPRQVFTFIHQHQA